MIERRRFLFFYCEGSERRNSCEMMMNKRRFFLARRRWWWTSARDQRRDSDDDERAANSKRHPYLHSVDKEFFPRKQVEAGLPKRWGRGRISGDKMIHAIFAPPSPECVPSSIEKPRISGVELRVVEGNREFRTSSQNIFFRNTNVFRHREHATTNK